MYLQKNLSRTPSHCSHRRPALHPQRCCTQMTKTRPNQSFPLLCDHTRTIYPHYLRNIRIFGHRCVRTYPCSCCAGAHRLVDGQAAQPKRSAIPSMEKKLKNASLVQESLENLLRATETDITDPVLKLAMGTTVNWESGMYARKRWKVAGR